MIAMSLVDKITKQFRQSSTPHRVLRKSLLPAWTLATGFDRENGCLAIHWIRPGKWMSGNPVRRIGFCANHFSPLGRSRLDSTGKMDVWQSTGFDRENGCLAILAILKSEGGRSFD